MSDPSTCRGLLEKFGSPVNVLHAGSLPNNIDELVNAGKKMGVDTRIFFARKANKALTFVDTVRDAGHGVDVASERELAQVLDRGVLGERIILSAAIKPDRLLELAISQGVVISADSRDELDRIADLAAGRVARVAPRVAPDPLSMPLTRFGQRAAQWQNISIRQSLASTLSGCMFTFMATQQKTVPLPFVSVAISSILSVARVIYPNS